jgi:hypothetical protein
VRLTVGIRYWDKFVELNLLELQILKIIHG